MKPHPPGAVASLACGVLALMAWAVPLLGLLLGIAAVINARRAARALVQLPDRYQPSGLATAGLVCGRIGVVFSLIATLVLVMILSAITALAHGAAGVPPAAHAPVPML